MTDEIRVMPGMHLGYQQRGAHSESLLYVASVRRAKNHTTAKLKRFSGSAEPGGVWAVLDHTVKFPDHMVRDPFRVITSADLRPRPRTADPTDAAIEAREHTRRRLEGQ